MLYSLSLIFLVGLSLAAICKKIKLPRIIGMLISGIILGPFVLDLIDSSILGISAELRKLALVIILIKAGLTLNISDLKKVGRSAILMSFLPATFETLSCVIFAPLLLGVSTIEAALMGAVLSAVSPAVVVPKMVNLIENKRGTDKSIPQLILAAASLDDVYVLVLFSAFLTMAQNGAVSAAVFANIPISIVLGIFAGAAVGFLLSFLFEQCFKKGHMVRNSMKVIIILAVSCLLVSAEDMLKNHLPFSGLLAVVSMALVLAMRSQSNVTSRLSDKFGKLWIAAEVILFVLVGAAIDVQYTLSAGVNVIFLIFINLCFRSVGVLLCLIRTQLNIKERVFCVISYLPKATVQAAIGSVPLAVGLPCGNMVLTVAVTAILITAPLGALGIDLTEKHLLSKH
ncbi:MAG: cation:proton antiporter [Ruminococcus sp.]|nr:cation:proton antiporter [Ruminococcus sp.]